MVVSFLVDKKDWLDLKNLLNESSDTAIIDAALTMFRWAVDESAQGRFIFSTKRDGSEVKKLVMKTLSNARFETLWNKGIVDF